MDRKILQRFQQIATRYEMITLIVSTASWIFPSYLDLAKEITAIRGCALLNLFEIDATDMNQNMSTHASGLRDDLIKWQVNL